MDPATPNAPENQTGFFRERIDRNRKLNRRAAAMALCSVILGLLIWAKLQMVASVPRRVLAEPKEAQHQTAGAASHEQSGK
jgi:hypothetical protein